MYSPFLLVLSECHKACVFVCLTVCSLCPLPAVCGKESWFEVVLQAACACYILSGLGETSWVQVPRDTIFFFCGSDELCVGCKAQ